MIWDGSPIHRRAEVKEFLRVRAGAVCGSRRCRPYAPDLNPDEGGWQHLKHVEMRNLTCLDLEELHLELHLAIGRLRQKPHLIRSFFEGAGLELETSVLCATLSRPRGQPGGDPRGVDRDRPGHRAGRRGAEGPLDRPGVSRRRAGSAAVRILLRSPLEGAIGAHVLSQVEADVRDLIWAQVRDRVGPSSGPGPGAGREAGLGSSLG